MIPIALLQMIYFDRIRKLQGEIQKEKSKMTVVAEEAFSNVRTVKAFANEDEEISKFLAGNILVQ
jgi:ABC-type multidrug transport system fused ATPase/permease subunit